MKQSLGKLYGTVHNIIIVCAAVFFLPLMLFISLAVLLDGGRPVLVRRHFRGYAHSDRFVFEFRTSACDPKNAHMGSIRTRLGSFLHSSGLYVLPALINFAVGWGVGRPQGEASNLSALIGYFASALQDRPQGRMVASEKQGRAIATTP